MTQADFNDRLQRLEATRPSTAGPSRPTRRGASAGPNHPVAFFGAVIAMTGVQVMKYANTNYETIRDSSGVGAAAGLGLGALGAFLFGGYLLMRALGRGNMAGGQARVQQPSRQASSGAMLFCSVLGFIFGSVACFFIFAAQAARYVDTEAARHLAIGGGAIGLGLVALSLLIGFFGLFVKGFGLGRVPVYFVLGCVLTFAVIRVFFGDVREWIALISVL